MQKLWKHKYDWDDELPHEHKDHWMAFREDIKALKSIKITRHIFGSTRPDYKEMHIFVDASEKAYGAEPIKSYAVKIWTEP